MVFPGFSMVLPPFLTVFPRVFPWLSPHDLRQGDGAGRPPRHGGSHLRRRPGAGHLPRTVPFSWSWGGGDGAEIGELW